MYLPPFRQDGDGNREEWGENMSPDEDEEEEDEDGPAKPGKKSGKAARKQDVRGFVRELRRELVAWHVRVDAVDLLREKLALMESSTDINTAPVESTGIMSLSSTALEARYVRLEWEDGRVGRFKLSNTGLVERAVVIGDQGRDKKTEEAMTGSGGRVETILERLREAA
jgi:central kinetochore subunit Mal2/MCM21